FLSGIDRRKGKFRSFLLAALEHYMANQRRDAHAQKRHPGASFIAFDAELDEITSGGSPDPAAFFEQQWAITLLNQVLTRLQSEFTASGRNDLYNDLKDALIGQDHTIAYTQIAAKHGSTEASIKMTVYRLRKRYREILLEELANTVSTPEEVQE